MDSFIIHGNFIQSKNRFELEEIKDSNLIILNGKVEGFYKSIPEEYSKLDYFNYSDKLIIPGLSDLHVHAPQYQFRGLWMDMELLPWLENHTFPEESRYKDINYANEAYDIFVSDIKKSATTRVCAFATIHEEATLLLMEKLEESGLSGYIGKVNTDRNAPEILIEETEESIKATLDWIEKSKAFNNIKPIITPRFIPTCSDNLLKKLGNISKLYNLPVQSHLSENLSEIAWVKELVPNSRSYADAYNCFGLWGINKTVMAHCVYSYETELELLMNPNLYVAHCPDSNTNLTSGISRVTALLDKGVNVGLGSDITGGEDVSIFTAMKNAIKVSKLNTRLSHSEDSSLTFAQAFYIATKLGGSFFGNVGAFIKGYDADIVVLDDSSIKTTLKKDLSLSERLEQYVYLKSNSEVYAKYVKGKKIEF